MSDYKQHNETGGRDTGEAVLERDRYRRQMSGRLRPDRGGRATLQARHIERTPDDVVNDDESGAPSRQWGPASGPEELDASGSDSIEPACEDGTHVSETQATESEAVDMGQLSGQAPEIMNDRPVDPLSPSISRDGRDECLDGGR